MIYGILIGLGILIGTYFDQFWWGLLAGVVLSLIVFGLTTYGTWLKQVKWWGWWKTTKVVDHNSNSGGSSTVVKTSTSTSETSFGKRFLDGIWALLLVLLGLAVIAALLYWGGPWFRLWMDDANVSFLPEKRQEKTLTLSGSVVQKWRECGLENGLWKYDVFGDTTVSTVLGNGQPDMTEMKLWGTPQRVASEVQYQRYNGATGSDHDNALLANGKAPKEYVHIADGCVTFVINYPYHIVGQAAKDKVRFAETYKVTVVFTSR